MRPIQISSNRGSAPAASSGCIRISASLNQFVDKYDLLDADYEAAMERGVQFWVLRPDRTPTPWSGRYLVVVESERSRRPAWAAAPRAIERPKSFRVSHLLAYGLRLGF